MHPHHQYPLAYPPNRPSLLFLNGPKKIKRTPSIYQLLLRWSRKKNISSLPRDRIFRYHSQQGRKPKSSKLPPLKCIGIIDANDRARPLSRSRRRHRRGRCRARQHRRASPQPGPRRGVRRGAIAIGYFANVGRYRRDRPGDHHRRRRLEGDDRRHDEEIRHDRHRLHRDERQRSALRRRAAGVAGRLHRGREGRRGDARRHRHRPRRRRAAIGHLDHRRRNLAIARVVRGFDLVGTAVGTVALDRILVGRDLKARRPGHRHRFQRHPHERHDLDPPGVLRAGRARRSTRISPSSAARSARNCCARP